MSAEFHEAIALARSVSNHVYGDRPLRVDVPSSKYSKFEDEVWSLEPVTLRENATMLSINFQTIPAEYRQVAKELIFAMLALNPPEGVRQLAPSTVNVEASTVRNVLRWLDNNSGKRLCELTKDDLATFLAAMNRQHGVNGQVIQNRLKALRYFYTYRSLLQSDSLLIEPMTLYGWTGRQGKVRQFKENRTHRIPETVLQPLIQWADRWVNEFATDIIEARKEFLRLRGKGRDRPSEDRKKLTLEQKEHALRQVLERYIENARPLPLGRSGDGLPSLSSVNRLHLSREADCVIQSAACDALVADAESKVGVDEAAYLWHEVADSGLRELLNTRIRTSDIPQLTTHLATACYILVAFYSGMRDSEIKSLRKGCLVSERDNTGQLETLKVRGLAFKGEESPNGAPASWVVGKPVAEAIRVLEALRTDGQVGLFAQYKEGGQGRRARKRQAISVQKTNKDLNNFQGWINEKRDQRLELEPTDQIVDERWVLTSSQFRRTLAWFIARRPGGSIAGAIQFRHHSVQMFEGYAGTSRSGFRAEVESEEALVRGEYLLDLAASGAPELDGPAARIAKTRAEVFATKVGYAGVVTDSSKQLQSLMQASEPGVYPGREVVCVFDPAKALCKRVSDQQPNLSSCVPLKCKNVALDQTNRDFWLGERRRLVSALSYELAPFVEHTLRKQLADISELLA